MLKYNNYKVETDYKRMKYNNYKVETDYKRMKTKRPNP